MFDVVEHARKSAVTVELVGFVVDASAHGHVNAIAKEVTFKHSEQT